MRLISAVAAMFILALTLAIAESRRVQQRIKSSRAQGRWRRHQEANGQADLPLRHVRRRAAVDRRAADARGHRRRSRPATALAVGLKVDVEGAAAAIIAALQRRPGRSDGPRRDRRAAAAERRRRRARQRQRRRAAHERRHHLRALPLVGRQLLRGGHRQAARRLGQHGPERRSDRRAVAGAGRGDQGRVQRLGPGQIRPAPSCVRRHEPHSAEQSVAADRHPADLRTEGRRLRDVHRRRPDLVLEQLRRRRADGRPGQLQRSSHRAVHQADAGSRHAEAGGAARLPTEPAHAGAAGRTASIAPPRGAASGCSARRPDARPAIRGRTSPTC